MFNFNAPFQGTSTAEENEDESAVQMIEGQGQPQVTFQQDVSSYPPSEPHTAGGSTINTTALTELGASLTDMPGLPLGEPQTSLPGLAPGSYPTSLPLIPPGASHSGGILAMPPQMTPTEMVTAAPQLLSLGGQPQTPQGDPPHLSAVELHQRPNPMADNSHHNRVIETPEALPMQQGIPTQSQLIDVKDNVSKHMAMPPSIDTGDQINMSSQQQQMIAQQISPVAADLKPPGALVDHSSAARHMDSPSASSTADGKSEISRYQSVHTASSPSGGYMFTAPTSELSMSTSAPELQATSSAQIHVNSHVNSMRNPPENGHGPATHMLSSRQHPSQAAAASIPQSQAQPDTQQPRTDHMHTHSPDGPYFHPGSAESIRSPHMSFVRSPHPPYYHMPVPSHMPTSAHIHELNDQMYPSLHKPYQQAHAVQLGGVAAKSHLPPAPTLPPTALPPTSMPPTSHPPPAAHLPPVTRTPLPPPSHLSASSSLGTHPQAYAGALPSTPLPHAHASVGALPPAPHLPSHISAGALPPAGLHPMMPPSHLRQPLDPPSHG